MTGRRDASGKRPGAEGIGKARCEDVETNSISDNCAEDGFTASSPLPMYPTSRKELAEELLLSPY